MEARAQLADSEFTSASLMDWEKRIGKELRVSNVFNKTGVEE